MNQVVTRQNRIFLYYTRMNGNLDLPVADIHQVAGVAFEITDCQATLGLVNGSYLFFHYLVDGFDDRGWGCAYRSLQTLASWCVFGQYSKIESLEASRKVHDLVPSMKELVHLTGHMFGNLADESTRWIGSMEVVAALDVLYGVSCTVLTFTCQRSRYEDDFRAATSRLSEHFSETGLRSPVMFGGQSGRALTILGISVRKSTASEKDLNDSNGMITILEGGIRLPHVQLLILDPHYINSDQKQGAKDRSQYARDGGIGWFDAHKVFRPDEFFNLCIPRSKADSGIRLFNSVTVAERIEQAIADYAKVEKQSDADWGIELVAGD